MSLAPFKVLLFDCYGTLVDWEGGMLANLRPLLEQSGAPDREQLFSVLGPHEGRIQTETPTMLYSEVLEHVYKAVGKELKLEVKESDAKAFGASVGSWPAFEDSADALQRLSKLGLKLVILSNVDNTSFEGSKKQLEKGYQFDAIYTAEKIGSYKPSLRNFDYAIENIKKDFGLNPEDILIVANSKLHDVQPGHKKGLKAAWIDRSKAVMGVAAYKDVVPDFHYSTMAEFTQAMEKAKSA
ncbi:haloacid dehalogenase, type II [Kwoniella heveanensis BCC8398]|uniref:Haloacid dehalogenase, type II n=1 Tax=Kwoniella heveanensis BCC8398 TaxID=1296120 RepID=A0A1B9GM93_9TREE|nr:haloacid dehalogenase, type II [Kwoniella heveanensis BCC8398]